MPNKKKDRPKALFEVPEPSEVLSRPTTAKQRATFYFSPETLDALRLGEVECRKIAREAGIRESRINRSWIVEAALLEALRDLAGKGKHCKVAGLI